ncbi:MAG: hypothetical protein ACT4QC_22095 [Planctomycetaceae bacterium]
MRYAILATVLVGAFDPAKQATGADRPSAESFLHSGTLREGEAALIGHLKQRPDDDETRFGLGTLQFIRAVEHLGQSLHRYGVGVHSSFARQLPFVRLPVPPNPEPAVLTYALSRQILEEMLANLTKSEATLAAIKDDAVVFRLRPGPIRLDLDGNGQADDPLQTILARYLGGAIAANPPADFEVGFDRGDVAWLRGYCHLLSALCEFALAHDANDLFAHTAHLFFARADTPLRALLTTDLPNNDAFDYGEVLDAVAFVHLMRLPVVEPKRMQAALGHLEQMLRLSRESWKFVLAETDDEHEWLPNPRQTGVLQIPIRQDQIDGWLEFVDESEALLTGTRLVPFWRGREPRGINLRRVFTEPRTFDLVLWVQGSAAVPYFEQGELTDRRVWDRLLRVFGGEFLGFALWFN